MRSVKVAKEEISDRYEQHLAQLQHRNRLLKQLTEKDEKTIDLEKRENGFTVYINGANTDLNTCLRQNAPPRLKTAETRKRRANDSSSMKFRESLDESFRAQTAPHSGRRRQWHYQDVSVKSQLDSEPIELRAPSHFTGEYEDDFADETSDTEEQDVCTENVDDGTLLRLSCKDIQTLRKTLDQESPTDEIKESLDNSDTDSVCSESIELPNINDSDNEQPGTLLDLSRSSHGDDTVIVLELDTKAADRGEAQQSRQQLSQQLSPSEVKRLIEAENQQFSTASNKTSTSPPDEVEPTEANRFSLVRSSLKGSDSLQNFVVRVRSLPTDQKQSLIETIRELDRSLNAEHEARVFVQLELISNYGHSTRIGLTELQFLDEQKRVLRVDVDEVKVNNLLADDGVKQLFSGQIKTTKPNLMWQTDISTEPISLSVPVILSLSHGNKSYLSQINIYNYNAPKELNSGVRSLRVHLGEQTFSLPNVPMGSGSYLQSNGVEIRLDQFPRTASDNFAAKIRWSASAIGEQPEAEPGPAPSFAAPITVTESQQIGSTQNSLSKSRSAWTEQTEVAEKMDESQPNQDGESDADLSFMERIRQITAVKANKPSARVNNHSQLDNSSDSKEANLFDEFDQLPRKKSTTESRSQWRKELNDTLLDKSLSSLDMFAKSHAGRLSTGNEANSSQSLTEQPPPSDSRVQLDLVKDPLSCVAETELNLFCDQIDAQDDLFRIPELPEGHQLELVIFTTWGDRFYVGLTGVEIFCSTGHLVEVEEITAHPKDINILPEYDSDPRVVSNLLDGINRTRDDFHMWLAPFTSGLEHTVRITFTRPFVIAMIRIWNYNKSRIHSLRGARDVELRLDGKSIFRGEIARASGGIYGGPECFGETILFTENEQVLELVGRFDKAYESECGSDSPDFDEQLALSQAKRPRTADKESDEERPFTRASGDLKRILDRPRKSRTTNELPAEDQTTNTPLRGRSIRLTLTKTWGDRQHIGLTGLQLLNENGLPISIEAGWLSVFLGDELVKDESVLRLLNEMNMTCDSNSMWLVPFQIERVPSIQMNFPRTMTISAIRLWNYNKSADDSYCGVKSIQIFVDDIRVIPPAAAEVARSDGIVLRKAPGNCDFDFAQEIDLADWLRQFNTSVLAEDDSGDLVTPRATASSSTSNYLVELTETTDAAGSSTLKSDLEKSPEASTTTAHWMSPTVSATDGDRYESGQLPCGFVYQLQLHTNYGDGYYIGLNGLEFFSEKGLKIPLGPTNVAANPDSVNVLDGFEHDVRLPDKLVNGINDTVDGRNMWLAPLLPQTLNKVYIVFDEPVTVSMIRIWNYAKTPVRGAKDFSLLVDDVLVYSGTLSQAPQTSQVRGILPTVQAPLPHNTIMFSDNEQLLEQEKRSIVAKLEQPASAANPEVDVLLPELRPTTSCLEKSGGRRSRAMPVR